MIEISFSNCFVYVFLHTCCRACYIVIIVGIFFLALWERTLLLIKYIYIYNIANEKLHK
jgi:hypothetical protein